MECKQNINNSPDILCISDVKARHELMLRGMDVSACNHNRDARV